MISKLGWCFVVKGEDHFRSRFPFLLFCSFGDYPVLLRYCPVQRPFCIFLSKMGKEYEGNPLILSFSGVSLLLSSPLPLFSYSFFLLLSSLFFFSFRDVVSFHTILPMGMAARKFPVDWITLFHLLLCFGLVFVHTFRSHLRLSFRLVLVAPPCLHHRRVTTAPMAVSNRRPVASGEGAPPFVVVPHVSRRFGIYVI